MTMCRNSRCWVPPKLSSSSAKESVAAKTEIVKRFYAPDDSEEPRRALEHLFAKLPFLKSQTCVEMRQEFEALTVEFSQAAQPDYAITTKLGHGIQALDLLIQEESSSEDLLQFMADNIVARDKHRVYFERVEMG